MIPQDSWPRLQDGVVGEEVVMVLVVVMEVERRGGERERDQYSGDEDRLVRRR